MSIIYPRCFKNSIFSVLSCGAGTGTAKGETIGTIDHHVEVVTLIEENVYLCRHVSDVNDAVTFDIACDRLQSG